MSTTRPADVQALDEKPWYRQFWPWVLIALPASAVIAGIATVFIAMHDPDGLVVDDYYKAGLAINRSLERMRTAADRGIRGRLAIGDGVLQIQLISDRGIVQEPVRLRLLHATRAGRDRDFSLGPESEGNRELPLEALPPGRWRIHVDGRDWRIVGDIQVPGENSAVLEAGS